MFIFTTVRKCVCNRLANIIRNISLLTFAVILEVSFALYKITKHDYDVRYDMEIPQPRCQHIRYARDRSPIILSQRANKHTCKAQFHA